MTIFYNGVNVGNSFTMKNNKPTNTPHPVLPDSPTEMPIDNPPYIKTNPVADTQNLGSTRMPTDVTQISTNDLLKEIRLLILKLLMDILNDKQLNGSIFELLNNKF